MIKPTKKILMLMMFIINLPSLTVCQTIGFRYSEAQRTEKNFDDAYIKDFGSWMSIKSGVQSNGGTLDERWTLSMSYDGRSNTLLAFVVEGHLWRNRSIQWNGYGYTKTLQTLFILSGAPKIRYNIKTLSFSVQGGVGTGVKWSPISLHYGVSIEYFFGDKFLISLSQKRYAYPELDHFIFIGVSIKIK